MKKHAPGPTPRFTETPKGIVTASGLWFRVTRAGLKEYADPVLERISIERLLSLAEHWFRLPQSLTLLSLPITLAFFSPAIAALVSILVYLIAAVVTPGIVILSAMPMAKIIDHVVFQFLLYVVALSILGNLGLYMALSVGLIGFVLIRWGAVQRVLSPLIDRIHRRMYALPTPDQILRGVIVRVALRHRISLPEIDEIEKSIRATWNTDSRAEN